MDKTTDNDLKKLFESIHQAYMEDDDAWPIPGMGDKNSKGPKASFPDDPLALSCASYRLYKNEPQRRFTNIELVKATQEDRTHAQAIRSYYTQRYTMKALKGTQLTDYQKKTAEFLSGLYHLTTEEIGLLYKLPYFYEEDQLIEQVVEQTTSYQPKVTPLAAELKDLTEYELTPLLKILVSRKGAEFNHFYFKDQNNHAVVIPCPNNDRFSYTLHGLFKQPKLRVRAYANMTKMEGDTPHVAIKLTAWELVF